MKTGVLVHGFHLQAPNWKNIVWGEPPYFLGRVPKGMSVALLEGNVDIIVFGTGASEKDGKKEAEYTRDYLLEHFYELAEFEVFWGFHHFLEAKIRIERILRVEIQSQNTAQEVQFAGRMFREVGVERIILVSSPAHISRCLRDALVNIKGVSDISAMPSQTSWADPAEVVIVEPSHRPDQPKTNLHSFVKDLLSLPREEQEKLIKKALG